MYERVLRERIRRSRRSVLVLGPRQVGKSTLLGSLAPDIRIDLAHPASYRDYVARPERLEAEILAAEPGERTVLIDEVQRVPALLDIVQVILDRKAPVRFLLSGSSARKLRRGQANLLPGRVHVHSMHPLLATEIGPDFDVERALAHGTLPAIYAETNAETRAQDLRSYADTYLREEVQAEALVRDVGGYARVLDLVAASSGKVVNVNALCRDAGVSYETVRRYLAVLEDTLVAFRVPSWGGADRTQLVSHPKTFLFDLGVRNALLRRPLDHPLDDERGLLLEHLIAYEIHRRLGAIWPDAALFHFRSRHGLEADFVLEVGREAWIIEVKSGRDVASSALRSVEKVAEHIPRAKRRIIVFLGSRAQRSGRVEVLPIDEFLALLPR